MKRLRHFGFPVSVPQGHRPSLHQLRDGDAYSLLAAAMVRGGGFPDSPICNGETFTWVPALDGDDVLVLCTRPELDSESEGKRRIACSGLPLEQAIFRAVRPYFSELTRAALTLSKEAAGWLPPAYADRASLSFRQYCSAEYTDTLRVAEPGASALKAHGGRATAAFLLVNPSSWTGPSELVIVWGMNGAMTLGWSLILAHRYAEYLQHRLPRFVMAEVVPNELSPQAASLVGVQAWTVTLLINRHLVS